MKPSWLAQLAPSHAPPPPGWWPMAPGWWLILLLGVLLAWGLARWWRNPARRRRLAALAELRRIRAATGAAGGSETAAESARAIENLLRRYAIAVFGRSRVAALSGEAWLNFLGAAGAQPLAGEAGRAMLAAAFGGPVHDQRTLWLAGAETFVQSAGRTRRCASRARSVARSPQAPGDRGAAA